MARFGALTVYAGQATQTTAFTPADGLLLLVGAVLLVLPGWLAYTGRWRRWTNGSYGKAFPYFPFGLAWMCAGGMLLGLASLISGLSSGAAGVLGIPAIVVFLCGLAFMLRTPRRFLPAWYREHSRGLR
jgi:hypothetical protein